MTTRDQLGHSGFKGRVFYQSDPPSNPKEGDLWIEIDPNYLTEIQRWCWSDQFSPAIWQSADIKLWIRDFTTSGSVDVILPISHVWQNYDMLLVNRTLVTCYSVAQSSANYWTIKISATNYQFGETTISQVQQKTAAANAWQKQTDIFNSIYKTSSYGTLIVDLIPTGSPGTLFFSQSLAFRLIKN